MVDSASRKAARIAAGLVLQRRWRKEKSEKHHILRIESGVYTPKLDQAAQRKPCANDRTRASAISTTTRTLCAPFREPLAPRPPSFKLSCMIRSRDFQRGRHAEKNSRQQRGRCGETAAREGRCPLLRSAAKFPAALSTQRAFPNSRAAIQTRRQAIPNKTLSVRSWRIKRDFPAPRARGRQIRACV